MRKLHRILGFILLFAMFTSIAYVLCGSFAVETALNAVGRTKEKLLFAVPDSRGNIHVLSGENKIITIKGDGTNPERSGSVKLPEGFCPDRMFADEDRIILSGYEENKGSLSLLVYLISPEGAKELLRQECEGGSYAQMRAGTQLSSISTTGGRISFFLKTEARIDIYSMDESNSRLKLGDTFMYDGEMGAGIITSDNTAYLISPKDGLISGKAGELELEFAEMGYLYTNPVQAGDGFSYVDAATGRVMHYSSSQGSRLSSDMDMPCPPQSLTYIYPGQNDILIIKEQSLLYRGENGKGYEDISGALYRPVWQSVLILTIICAAVLALTCMAYHMLFKVKGRYFPSLLRSGIFMALAACICVFAVVNVYVKPGYFRGVRQPYIDELTEECARLSEAKPGIGGKQLLADTEWFVLSTKSDGKWRLSSAGGTAYANGALAGAPGMPGYLTDMAERAGNRSGGAADTVCDVYRQAQRTYYTVGIQAEDGNLYIVSGDASHVQAEIERELSSLRNIMLILSLVIILAALLSETGVVIGLGRIQKGVSLLNEGCYDITVVQRGGDELELLADTVNALAQKMEEKFKSDDSVFSPRRFASLLGADEGSAEIEAAVMEVRISFQEEVNRGRPSELFKRLNDILERSGEVVAKHGGVMYNISAKGFSGVFRESAKAAVCAAVEMQQEMLAFGGDSDKDGESGVDFRIAIDKGGIAAGSVGGDSYAVPAVVSQSLDTAQFLVRLSEKLGTNILCTMSVSEAVQDQNVRYIGKARNKDEVMRVYEVFDGDSPRCREHKEKTRNKFSEGVLTLYTRDFAKAKQIFKEIEKESDCDTVAKRYLYMAEGYEKKPPEEIVLGKRTE